MIFKKLYQSHVQSLQSKLIVNVILIHAILMSLIIIDLIQREHSFMQEQLSQKGYELTSVLASNTAVSLLNNDVVALDELLTDMDQVQDSYMMFILDYHGRVKASTNKDYLNKVLDDAQSIKALTQLIENEQVSFQMVHNNLTDTIHSVKVGSKTIGYIRTLLNQDSLSSEMNIVTKRGVIYVVLAIVLGAFFAWLSVRQVTARLNHVARAAEQISDKDFNVHLPASKHDDELSKMIKAFSTMSHSINGYVEELKLTSSKVQKRERELLEAQEIGHIGSWELDLKTSKMQWSPETYRINDKDPKSYEPSLETFFENVDKNDVKAIQDSITRAVETGVKSELESKLYLDDGRVKYIYLAGIAEYDENGTASKIRGVTQDITEHKIDEKHLKEREAQLLAQSRLAQMGEMISMIAHQWRQPLSAISATAMNHKVEFTLGNFELGTEKGREECTDKSIKDMEDIEMYVQSLSSTIDDFRNFYKPNKETIYVSLDTIVKKSLAIIKTSLKNNTIELIYEANAHEELALFEGEVMQVILNVLKNAQDNFKEKEIKDSFIKIKTSSNSVAICDNGGGIPEEIFDKIYDPYFSSKTKKNGTGLGLYMSKIIIEEHHKGSLELKNVDDGVCCYIKFPKL